MGTVAKNYLMLSDQFPEYYWTPAETEHLTMDDQVTVCHCRDFHFALGISITKSLLEGIHEQSVADGMVY